MEGLDKFRLGSGLVCIVGGMGGKGGWRFGGDVLIVGGDNPEAGGGVALAHKHELRLAVDLAILFGKDDMTAVVAELFDGQKRRMCES